jgi:site-specific DNA-methyltransferase (adenine-specific)
MKNHTIPRLDEDTETRETVLPFCRLSQGEVWTDPKHGHKVACLDATDRQGIHALFGVGESVLAIQDPPYNLVAFDRRSVDEYIAWCRSWIQTSLDSMAPDASLYVWLGADQDEGFQPLPEFMLMMREFEELRSRSLITMRNQRGYGTQKNWMAVRQECLFYIKGDPSFTVQYTDIPKILRGYYKDVNGKRTENMERSKSENIRPGNVWVDVQQVFYRMDENVNGCYAQKPLKAIERLICASSQPEDIVIDYFGHSGTTLIAAELNNRTCYTCDIDPVYCEIMIRRLERFRSYGKLGWQNGNPFQKELAGIEDEEQCEMELW